MAWIQQSRFHVVFFAVENVFDSTTPRRLVEIPLAIVPPTAGWSSAKALTCGGGNAIASHVTRLCDYTHHVTNLEPAVMPLRKSVLSIASAAAAAAA